jgi:hypothetical protein
VSHGPDWGLLVGVMWCVLVCGLFRVMVSLVHIRMMMLFGEPRVSRWSVRAVGVCQCLLPACSHGLHGCCVGRVGCVGWLVVGGL